MPVHGQNHVWRRDLPPWRPRHPIALPLKRQNRRLLVDNQPVGTQSSRDLAHVKRGLNIDRARREQPASIIVRPRDRAHILRVEFLECLAHRAQMPREIRVMRPAAGARRAIDLTRPLKGLVGKVELLNHLRRKRDGTPIVFGLQPVALKRATVVLTGKIMRQINHETRVAARRTFCDPPRFKQHDPVSGAILRQAARSGKPRISAPDNQPIRRRPGFKRRRWVSWLKQACPARRSGILWQPGHTHHVSDPG